MRDRLLVVTANVFFQENGVADACVCICEIMVNSNSADFLLGKQMLRVFTITHHLSELYLGCVKIKVS